MRARLVLCAACLAVACGNVEVQEPNFGDPGNDTGGATADTPASPDTAVTCTPPLVKCGDGACRECCGEGDTCGEGGTCHDFVCQPACNLACFDPTPNCKLVNGTPTCVACLVDGDCPVGSACYCRQDTFTCFESDSSGACATAVADCQYLCSAEGGGCKENHACNENVNLCYDPTGECSPTSGACCSPGEKCIAFRALLPGDAAVQPDPTATHPERVCGCNMGRCADPALTCTKLDVLCQNSVTKALCDADGLPPKFLPSGVCFDMTSWLARAYPGL